MSVVVFSSGMNINKCMIINFLSDNIYVTVYLETKITVNNAIPSLKGLLVANSKGTIRKHKF